MAPRVDPVTSDTELPARTGVVVVGGGIIGTSTAFFLARKGIPVVLCEKGHIAGEQSSRNWGWARKMGRDPREIPLAIEALRLWPQLNELTEAETGFRQCGIVYLCKTRRTWPSARRGWRSARPYQLDTRMLTREEAAAVLPGLSGEWRGGLYTQSDGRGEPQKAAPAIANAARRHGATVMQQCAVRGIETKGGRVVRRRHRKGPHRLRQRRAGRRRMVAAVLRQPRSAAAAAQGDVVGDAHREIRRADWKPHASGFGFGVRKRLDGGYNVASWSGNVHDIVPDTFRFFSDFMPSLKMQWSNLRLRVGGKFIQDWQVPRHWALDAASPFEKVRTLDPEPYQPILDQARTNLTAAFPAFRDMKVAETWGGVIDVTPDGVPVISGVDKIPGFFIATGFTGHGFGIGPGAGRLMAEIVAGETPVVDPTPFRYSRFTDGTRPVPSPLV